MQPRQVDSATPLPPPALFFATAAFTLWQNARVAVLWDISYLLDSSFRISLGQMPYRDFPFAHAPLTFLLHAAIIRVFGRVYFPHIVCAALEAGAATLLTWRILLGCSCRSGHAATSASFWRSRSRPPNAHAGSSPRCSHAADVLGIYGIYPHPIYDSDCILAVLAALYLLQRADESPARNALAGAACVLPLFFKQNIGLPVPADHAGVRSLVIAVAPPPAAHQRRPATLALRRSGGHLRRGAAGDPRDRRPAQLSLLDHHLCGPAPPPRPQPDSRRPIARPRCSGPFPRPSPACCSSAQRSSAASAGRARPPFLLLAAPFLWTIAALALTNDPDDRADQLLSLWPHLLLLAAALAVANLRPRILRTSPTLNTLLPVILLATIHGTFLSQQLWGSTYAIWPLLMLLIAAMLTQVPPIARPTRRRHRRNLPALRRPLRGQPRAPQLHPPRRRRRPTPPCPKLRGLTTPGPWIPDFEELVRFTNTEIPANDAILLLPGEDPVLLRHRPHPAVPRSALRPGHRSLHSAADARPGPRPQHPLAHRHAQPPTHRADRYPICPKSSRGAAGLRPRPQPDQLRHLPPQIEPLMQPSPNSARSASGSPSSSSA